MNLGYRLVVVPVFVAIIFFIVINQDALDTSDQHAHMGVWTAASGQPGNRIRFWYAPVQSDASSMSVYEGRVSIDNLFGYDTAQGQWNHGYFEPLILNLVVDQQEMYLLVRPTDDDRLVVTHSTDCQSLLMPMSGQPMNQPNTVVLNRAVDVSDSQP